MHSQKPDMEKLYQRLGYRFADPDIAGRAFRHASFVNEQAGDRLEDNERLEFLGDAVLDLVVSHLLMERYPDAEEGRLSKLRAVVVDESGLHRVALDLRLGDHLKLGRGEEQSGGRAKPSILSDTLEALFGAVYLDGGFDKALDAGRRLFEPLLENFSDKYYGRDFKSMLQEFTQREYRMLPGYRLEEEAGPAHSRTFRVAVVVDGRVVSCGEGKNKKEAEQRAAREAFHLLTGRKGL